MRFDAISRAGVDSQVRVDAQHASLYESRYSARMLLVWLVVSHRSSLSSIENISSALPPSPLPVSRSL
jgi:hypothetical protein